MKYLNVQINLVEQDHGQTKIKTLKLFHKSSPKEIKLIQRRNNNKSQDCHTEKFNDLWLFGLVSLV